MSCERCAESAASGSKVCEFCGESLEPPSLPQTAAAAPPSASAAPVRRSGEQSPARRVLTFIGGFFMAFFLMGLGMYVGSAVAGGIGATIGALGAPVLMILVASSADARALVGGGITALAVVIIVFGGCLMLLSL